jgi:hypothetical protein
MHLKIWPASMYSHTPPPGTFSFKNTQKYQSYSLSCLSTISRSLLSLSSTLRILLRMCLLPISNLHPRKLGLYCVHILLPLPMLPLELLRGVRALAVRHLRVRVRQRVLATVRARALIRVRQRRDRAVARERRIERSARVRQRDLLRRARVRQRALLAWVR